MLKHRKTHERAILAKVMDKTVGSDKWDVLGEIGWMTKHGTLTVALVLIPAYGVTQAIGAAPFSAERGIPILAWWVYVVVGMLRAREVGDSALKAVAKLSVWPGMEWRRRKSVGDGRREL